MNIYLFFHLLFIFNQVQQLRVGNRGKKRGMKTSSLSGSCNVRFASGLAQVWFNSRCWLHCQLFLLEFKSLQDKNWQSQSTNRWRHYSANLPKICDIIGPKLKILGKKLICSQYLDWQFLLSLNILSFWTYDVTNFPKISEIMSPPICHFRFLIFVLETLKFEWQCSQYLELNLTCVW